MSEVAVAPSLPAPVEARANALYADAVQANYARTSRLFAWLMGAQWLFAVVLALVISPSAWAGKTQSLHLHVWGAVVLGGILTSLPVFLAVTQPAASHTRIVVATAQMLWSALLIHLTGGRIETHFHIFGSLAFVAFYRDVRLLTVATVAVAADHFLRGVYWPESVYGVANPEWWRFFEHAAWVVFEDIVLFFATVRGLEEVRAITQRQAQTEALTQSEREKSAALAKAMDELNSSHEALARSQRLAAVGQLAASVGHELRNPLAAVRNAHTFLARKIKDANGTLSGDARVAQFVGVVDRELDTCNKIISDLLDFSRERAPALRPCPLKPLVDEAISVVPPRAGVRVHNKVAEELPVPTLDKDQFRQVLVNLVQNAVEAMPEGGGEVSVVAEGGGDTPWRIRVVDNGAGIPPEVVGKIFEPLFSTKNKGTGLGLAIVSNMIKKHGGSISVDSSVGRGTEFRIELPVPAPVAA